jgi:hypothetical protein
MVEVIYVLLQTQGIRDDSLALYQLGDEAFPPPPVGHGMEERRACIPLEQPRMTTSLLPVLLPDLQQVRELILKVIPHGPPLFIKTT